MQRDEVYLVDMLLAAEKIEAFIEGLNRQDVLHNEVLLFAILRLIQIIGEAASKISPDYHAQHPEIPWRRMIGMRHRLVHEYFNIDTARVWEVVSEDVPRLIQLLTTLVPFDEA